MEVVPFKSVGNLNFSDSRQDIRRKLNTGFVAGVYEFDGLKELYDYFEEIDVKILYDVNSQISAFEFYMQAESPTFQGLALLSARFTDLIRVFSELDPDFEVDAGNFTSNKYGIGGQIDYSQEREIACADSVIVFRQGYYDVLKK